MPKAETSADKEETAEKLGITRSRGRRGKQANDEESSKINAAPVTKRKGKAQASVHEAATQIYDGEEATQRYGDEGDKQKGIRLYMYMIIFNFLDGILPNFLVVEALINLKNLPV